jgi:adenylate cyclase
MLTGDFPRLHRMRRIWGALPSPPRCKLCNAPFRGPGGLLMRAIAYGPSPLNRRLCKWCIRAVHKHLGGAEVEISVLFADVRRSTAIAERMQPEEFSRLMARFYGATAGVIDAWDGIVDRFVGDSAVALFIPGFAGSDHAADAIAAGGASSSRPGTTGQSRGFQSAPGSTPGSRLWVPSGKAMPETSRHWATRSTRPLGSQASRGPVRS